MVIALRDKNYTRAGGYNGYVAIEFVLTTAKPSLEARLIKRNGNKYFIFIVQNIENVSKLVKGLSNISQIYVNNCGIIKKNGDFAQNLVFLQYEAIFQNFEK